jgi:xylulose-5-phosphate/fructose-6-phosphate phosphoketolase
MHGYGYEPLFVEGDDPAAAASGRWQPRWSRLWRGHPQVPVGGAGGGFAADPHRPRWPMIVLSTPKGWTGPKIVDGLAGGRHLARPSGADRRLSRSRCTSPSSRTGCAVIGPAELFDDAGRFRAEFAASPSGQRRMGCNPHANGGLLLQPLKMPDFRESRRQRARARPRAGGSHARARRIPARRDAPESRRGNFRLFGPDETASNRLDAVYSVTGKSLDGRDGGRRREPERRRPRHGSAERASVPGLARGIPADRAATGCSRATRRSSTSSIRC